MKAMTHAFNRVQQPSTASSDKGDLDDIFGTMVAGELKNFPENIKFQVKHEINNVIYKFRMQDHIPSNHLQ